MKTFHKVLAVVLAAAMLCGVAAVCAGAVVDPDAEVTVNLISQNVAGLPNINAIIGQENATTVANQTIFGKLMNDYNDFPDGQIADVILVQEDFGYHDYLAAPLMNTTVPEYILDENGNIMYEETIVDGSIVRTPMVVKKNFNYQTNTTGGVPGGDGLNIFSQNRIYNEKRVTWNKAGGPITDGDALTAKGILYAVINVGNDFYIDFYNIHADAFDNEESVEARKDNYRQLAALINANYEKNNRPVIVVGDFNYSISLPGNDSDAMKRYLYDECGLTDAWYYVNNVEVGSGTYEWGVSDSVDKILYKGTDALELEATFFEYHHFKVDEANDPDFSLSDHPASVASITVKVKDGADYDPDTSDLYVDHGQPQKNFLTALKYFFKDLIAVFKNLKVLLASLFNKPTA